MIRPLFMASDPFAGADPRLRRSLSQMDLTTSYIVRTLAACKALKMKAKAPCYEGEALAHIGIPSKKVAIYFRNVLDSQRLNKVRAEWEAVGWKLLAVVTGDIISTNDEDLKAQLAVALKELGR